MKLDQWRDAAIIAFCVFNLVLSLWGWAQQTLIATSQANQQVQQLRGELEKAKAVKPPGG